MNSRHLYSTDASVFEQVPLGIECPQTVDECIVLIERAKREQFSLIARGGGTSIAGQCVGDGVVIDMSRHLSAILGADVDGTRAAASDSGHIWVQPGVVLDDLNDFLRRSDLQFPVDISTSSRCTIGGMAGNNAAGSHSLIYGTTREHVTDITAILSDGSTVHFKALTEKELVQKQALPNLEGEIYRQLYDIVDKHRQSILDSYPDPSVIRRNTGYALDALASGQPWVADGELFNLSRLICGSEGTLCLITALHLRLSPLVKGRALACVHFDSLDMALDMVPEFLEFQGIAAIELIDAKVLNAAKKQPGQSVNQAWIKGQPEAVLVCEFFDSSLTQASNLAETAMQKLQNKGIGYAWPVLTGADAGRVWALRKAGLGLLMGVQQRARPVAVIEDSAVPVEKLGEFCSDIKLLLNKLDVGCVYYGHASVGLLHLRPELDLDNEGDRSKFKLLAQSMAVLVKKYRGSLSGEHGDGRLRAPFLRDFLGNEVYELNQKIKAVFDPRNIFNPGKLIGDSPIDSDLRRRPTGSMMYHAQTGFSWQAAGGFDLVLERCNGTGTCRQKAGRGAMCPTFQATGEEIHSPRGRANLLRQAFASTEPDKLRDQYLDEAMATCLGCKACKSECPSGVDISAMKSEYLHRRGGKRLQRSLSGNHRFLLRLVSCSPVFIRTLFNRVFQLSFIRNLFGFQRQLPRIARRPFSRQSGFATQGHKRISGKKNVILVIDPFVNQMEPGIAESTMLLLNALGYVVVTYVMRESIRALVSEGNLEVAKAALRRLQDDFEFYQDMTIVGLEPAELLLLRDEAPVLLQNWSVSFSNRCKLLEEFLLVEYHAGCLPKMLVPELNASIAMHPHCHVRSAGLVNVTTTLLSAWAGVVVNTISTGCCGMGGRFGYKYFDISRRIFNVNVKSDIENKIVIVSGSSCREQFHEFTSIKTIHLSQLLYSWIV